MDSGADPTVPSWNWAEEELVSIARHAADVLAGDSQTWPAVRRPPAEQLAIWAHAQQNEDGRSSADLLEEITVAIAPYPLGNAHPRFSDWVNSPPHPLGAMTAGLAAAVNPSVAGAITLRFT